MVFSELDMQILNEIGYELSQMEEPIVLLPKREQNGEEVKQLILLGVRIIFAPADTIVSFSLSQTLKNLEMIFYGEDGEFEVTVEHKDLYEILCKGTVTEFYESDGHHMPTVIMTALNTPKGLSDVCGVLTLFEITEDYPIMNVAEAMDIIEELMPEESGIIFETRNTHTKSDYVKVVFMASRYVDLVNGLQKEIDYAQTHLGKVSVIVDALYEGSLTYEEAKLLAHRNSISESDVNIIYEMIYVTPAETVKLVRLLRDDGLSTEKKEEAIATALIETNIDTDLVEELIISYRLSVDNVLSIRESKREEKKI